MTPSESASTSDPSKGRKPPPLPPRRNRTAAPKNEPDPDVPDPDVVVEANAPSQTAAIGPEAKKAGLRPVRSRHADHQPATDQAVAPDPPAAGEAGPDEEYATGWFSRDLFGNASAVLVSVVIHLVLLLLLGLWMLPQIVDVTFPALNASSTMEEEQLETPELDTPIDPNMEATEVATAAAASAGIGGLAGVGEGPTIDSTAAGQIDGTGVALEGMPISLPGQKSLISKLPEGTLGEARAIVDNYDQALDRITQEILMMLAESPVLVIWCFDQSESMKDDQQEIRVRISKVYRELGLQEAAQGDALHTAVTSFGAGFIIHTEHPTGRVREIEDAIDEVPIDPSGKEMTCQAVGQSIAAHRSAASKGRRKMALILVSDESGNPENNVLYLEPTIAEAKAARCTVYVLGREAVFGYPFAHMSWRHPQTGHIHWLPIDRGPETGFVEQLQTEGFRRRYDAHPSGFGPYEHVRIAQQTGGIFFMLPSLETKLVRGEKRRYELEAMRPYLPDMRARQELLAERDASPLRAVLWKIINDLNPYRQEIADAMEVRFEFSAKPETFAKQVFQEQEKAKQYILYLDAAAKALEEIRPRRQQEYNPRWQANYDIIYAQVLAYTARTYEYGAYLQNFIENPKVVPFEKPKMLRLSEWHIRETSETVGGTLTESYVARASQMFHDVIKDHPGTPWSARAQWELGRGFGVDLIPRYHYYGPRPKSGPSKPRPVTIPVPKL